MMHMSGIHSHASAHVRFLHKTKKEQFHNKYLLSVMYTLTEVVLWWFWTNNGINLHCIDYFCYMSIPQFYNPLSAFSRNGDNCILSFLRSFWLIAIANAYFLTWFLDHSIQLWLGCVTMQYKTIFALEILNKSYFC